MSGHLSKIERHSTLSCVKQNEGGSLCYWNVRPTGDWSTDVTRGKELLNEVIAYMRTHEEPMIMQHILLAIGPGVTGVGGIEAGFLQGIGSALIRAS